MMAQHDLMWGNLPKQAIQAPSELFSVRCGVIAQQETLSCLRKSVKKVRYRSNLNMSSMHVQRGFRFQGIKDCSRLVSFHVLLDILTNFTATATLLVNVSDIQNLSRSFWFQNFAILSEVGISTQETCFEF